MGKKNRMKNGLDSLFDDNFILGQEEEAEQEEKSAPAAENVSSGGAVSVRISHIEPDRSQPRKDFNSDKLNELAENIAQMGVLQPILVRPGEAEGRYTIVAGERRWRAARLAGLTEVPVIIKEMTELEAAQIALIENLQREDLNPMEEAMAYLRLKVDFHLTQEEIAKAVGKSRTAVANSMRLLDLPQGISSKISEGKISVGHAKVLCGVSDTDRQFELAEIVMNEGISVRELERLAAKTPKKKPGAMYRAVFGSGDKQYDEYALSLKNEYGVKAGFKKKADGSTVMNVSFKNDEELKEFFRHLGMK